MPQFGVNTTLEVHLCEDAHDATKRGFFYRPPIFLPIEIDKVVVVDKGTVDGNATVDLVMVDEKGQKYVCMVTANLLRSLPI